MLLWPSLSLTIFGWTPWHNIDLLPENWSKLDVSFVGWVLAPFSVPVIMLVLWFIWLVTRIPGAPGCPAEPFQNPYSIPYSHRTPSNHPLQKDFISEQSVTRPSLVSASISPAYPASSSASNSNLISGRILGDRWLLPLAVERGWITMGKKFLTCDLRSFIDNVNQKDKKHNGKKIRFAFVRRKRK